MIADHKLLGDAHVHIVIRKLKSKDFFRDLEDHRIGLSLDKEVEWPVVDVVCDWCAESLGGLAAEDYIETCLLTRWDHLR